MIVVTLAPLFAADAYEPLLMAFSSWALLGNSAIPIIGIVVTAAYINGRVTKYLIVDEHHRKVMPLNRRRSTHFAPERFVQFDFLNIWVRLSANVLIILWVCYLCGAHLTTLLAYWNKISPFQSIGTPLLACGLGFASAESLNTIFPLIAMHRRYMESEDADSLEVILYSQGWNKNLVMIVMKSREVYVAYVKRLPVAIASKPDLYITVTPMFSGHLSHDKLELVFDDAYYESLNKTPASTPVPPHSAQLSSAGRFSVVLPISEISSVDEFDLEAYRALVEEKTAALRAAAAVQSNTGTPIIVRPAPANLEKGMI